MTFSFVRVAVLFWLVAYSLIGSAQTVPSLQQDRVSVHPNLRATTRLGGYVPRWASGDNDAGAVPADIDLHLTLTLLRSPELQAAFEQLLANQMDPASPEFHRWLTPQQVGDLYGPTRHDLDALTEWLTSQGMTVTDVAPSRVFVTVAAPASTVVRALGTELRYFETPPQAETPTPGRRRISAATAPSIPSAFAGIIASITGLTDAAIEPMHRLETVVATSTSGNASTEAAPQYSIAGSGAHYLSPGDFATIYDLNPVYSAGYNGTGQKVAIIGRSRVVSADISQFEANTGLPANLPNVIVPPTGSDPGVTGTGDQAEATLDVIRLIGTAPGVQADLVVSRSTAEYDGLYVAAQYEVQTLLDPVMNISFGSCEAYAGASGVSLWDTLFSQAASEGISVFVSSADSGAATCDSQFGTPPAYQIRSINYICASAFATCVGATELADTADPSRYWSPTNSANRASALSYIPEGAWNDPTTVTSSLGAIRYVAASGGGGASIYIPKPVWQTGLGVPADGARDVPDVSFPGSAHNGYYACYSTSGASCLNGTFTYFYGTSAAAPAMAGVTALLNQRTRSSQGNLNPLLYRLAAGNPNVFHDATPASSGVATCDLAIPSLCNNSTPSANGLLGGLAGYALSVGYDQATGLGSLDIAGFLDAAALNRQTSSLVATKLVVSGTATTISQTQPLTFTATVSSAVAGTPTGTVQFYANGTALGSPVALLTGKAVAAGLLFPAAGNYLVSATYSGDAVFAATSSAGVPLTVTGASSSTKLTQTSSSIPAGATNSFTITVLPAVGGAAVPTGTVRLYASSNISSTYLGTLPLVNGTATATSSFAAAGSYSISALYSGDAVFSPSTSPSISMTVVASPAYQISVTSPSITLSVGATTNNTDTVIVTPANGFTGPVNLACSVTALGAASPGRIPTCTFDKTSVTLAAGGTSSANLLISTVQSRNVHGGTGSAADGRGFEFPWSHIGEGTSLCVTLLWLLPGRRRRPWRALPVVLILAGTSMSLSGCGSSASSSITPDTITGTTAGTYMVTIMSSTTVSGAAIPQGTTVVLIVN